MRRFHRGIPFALTLLAAGVSQLAHGVPTSGDYVADKQNTWVQDKVGDRISTVNMIMCIMSSLRADAMVNQGPYVALVDQGKCEGRGDNSKSGSTSAGASNATNYMSSVVVSTQASASDPLVVNAWLHDEQDGGGGGSPQKVTIYAYIVAAAGKSDANPNGLFSMYFCGMPDGLNTCMFSGSLKSDSSGLSFYQAETGGGGGGGASTTALKLQTNPSTDSGAGLISTTENSVTSNFTFAYDANTFHRNDGTVDACLTRDINQANYSTWRYGTYQADGSRLDMTNPGFPVKYTVGSDTYYGFWGFWGLWLPESAMATVGSSGTLTHRVGSSDVALSVVKKGGKLWKLTRHSATLDDFKNVSMMFWAPSTISTLTGGNNYELQWDGSNLKAIGRQDCSAGQCVPVPLSPQVTLHASDFTAANVNAVSVFFPSGGGNGALVVPPTGDFIDVHAAQSVYYRSRDVVDPNDSAAPTGLHCVSMCPKSGTTLTAVFPGGGPAGDPFVSRAWGNSSTTEDYTFGGGMLSGVDGVVNASAISKADLGQYQWGLTSGSMVADADLASVKCNLDGTPNTSGSYFCPGLMDQAATTYQWETGPNQWNQYFGAAGVTIDAPKSLSFTASGSNIRAADTSKYSGSTFQLQFSGFGELQGVPGGCVDPNTNLPATSCDQNSRWVPAFDIVDDAIVSEGSTDYFVKYLEREMRLGNTSCAGAPSLAAATGLTLPTSALVDVNPVTTNGPEPTPATPKPAVIDGIVQ